MVIEAKPLYAAQHPSAERGTAIGETRNRHRPYALYANAYLAFALITLSIYLTIIYIVAVYKIFEISDNLRKIMDHQGVSYKGGTSKGIVFGLGLLIAALLGGLATFLNLGSLS